MCLCLEEKVVNRIMVFNSRMIGFVISNLRIILLSNKETEFRGNYRIYYHSKHIGPRQLTRIRCDFSKIVIFRQKTPKLIKFR